jgi:probable HAF family extracellular repeat protein
MHGGLRATAQVVSVGLALLLGACVGGGSGATPRHGASIEATQPAAGTPSPTAAPSLAGAYEFTDLGVLGGLDSAGLAVSEAGVVVGHADTAPFSQMTGFHAFWWPPMAGTMIDLGTLAGDSKSSAAGVNEKNAIVGISMAEDGRTHAFLWDGAMHDIGNLGAELAEANAVNESGQVVGASAARPGRGQHAFLWTPSRPNGANGRMVDLGILPNGRSSYAMDVNDRGVAVGYANDTEWMSHPFLWVPDQPNAPTGTMIELPYLPGAEHGVAEAVNAEGSVVGSMEVGSPVSTDRAFLWTPNEPNGTSGAIVDLGTLGGDHSYAFGVNTAGDVVGYAQLPGDDSGWPGVDHAFLYTDGVMFDLNSVLPSDVTGVELMMAQSISDGGQIVGTAVIDGHRHAYLLTPLPDH